MANWVPILGKVDVTDDERLRYDPTPILTEGPNAGLGSPALIRSDREFESGEISFEVHLLDPRSSCQVALNQGLQTEVFIGLFAGAGPPYGIFLLRNAKWEVLTNAGSREGVITGQWVPVRVRVLGSKVDLLIKDVKVCSGLQSISKTQIALLLQSPSEILVRKVVISGQKPRAFVVMQFSAAFDALYNEVIKPTCEKFGYEVVRADDIYKTGLIIEDITRSIQEASIVIADITPDNPNVFYEVGYAHGIKKATILLSERERKTLPFDVSGFRTLFYDDTIGGKREVETRLTKHLENLSS